MAAGRAQRLRSAALWVQALRRQAALQGEALRRLGAAYEALSAEHDQWRADWQRLSEFERNLARPCFSEGAAARPACLPPGGQGLPPGAGTAGLALIAEMRSLRKAHHQTRMEFKAMREELKSVRRDLDAARGDVAALQSWRRAAERETEAARARPERSAPSTPGSPPSRLQGARRVP
ncbi:unnamed protein product [Prorocentrum cordatum]|uniref:Centrosomal protein POC5 n=1 Tax=Prorocentrum cordatum TaxID=2364126 RepID=A0ABN9VU70_9DINO|nr:unnamed protein product [Polarella glacialis]